uniref:Uncharacterized protein n=1 Tax=Megaviridae environmental sample TaxID=1737588 RepID=A0A5J6VK33_9VIRU|nr:MAG: hypothetical protein [Megaviridae environmental sample]
MLKNLNLLQKIIILLPSVILLIVGLIVLIIMKLVIKDCKTFKKYIGDDLVEDDFIGGYFNFFNYCTELEKKQFEEINYTVTTAGIIFLILGIVYFFVSYIIMRGLSLLIN